MAPKSKWLSSIAACAPAGEAARKALKGRLATVRHYLPLAAVKPWEDSEYVHQLRVASRRAVAAIEIFRDFLLPDDFDWLVKHVRKIRKAAGGARDLDVLALWLERQSPSAEPEAADWCRKRITVDRRNHQEPIRKLAHRWDKKQRWDKVDKIVRRVQWRGDSTEPNARDTEPLFREVALVTARPLVEAFGRAKECDLSQVSSLHALRIAVKQLRYSMELFASVLHDDFRQSTYPILAQLQESLGAVNDHASHLAWLTRWLEAGPARPIRSQLEAWRDNESRELAAAMEAFRATWTGDRLNELLGRLLTLLDSAARPADCSEVPPVP